MGMKYGPSQVLRDGRQRSKETGPNVAAAAQVQVYDRVAHNMPEPRSTQRT
jgi:hypothetical protein